MEVKAIIFDADGVVINSSGYFSVQYEKEFGVSNDVMAPFLRYFSRSCCWKSGSQRAARARDQEMEMERNN